MMIIRDHLIRFHQTHYVAPNMRLAVLGSASIDDMSSWVTKHFSDVPVSYPSVPPSVACTLSPADSISQNFDRDWFRMFVVAAHLPRVI